MNHKLMITCLLVCCTQQLFSQQKVYKETKKIPANIRLGYWGGIGYPGLKTGIELPLSVVYKYKTKKSGRLKSVTKKRYLVSNFGWYHHKGFHDNLSLTIGYTYRRTSKSGFFLSYSPEIGYSRTFLGGTTYQVDDTGQVSIKKGAGHHYATLMLSGGLGWKLSIKNIMPITIYSRLNLMLLFPYNSNIYLRPNIELGSSMTLAHFLKRKTRHTTKRL